MSNLKSAIDLRRSGRFEDCLRAIASIETSVPAPPKETARKLTFLKADVLLDMKRFREAIGCYDRLLSDSPSDVACANKGLAYWELGEYESALSCYLESIRLNPSNEIAQRGVGEMHIKLGSPNLAIPFLNKALELKSSYQAAYTALGIAFYQTGAWSRAHEALKRALELDPSDWEAKKGLGLIEKHFE